MEVTKDTIIGDILDFDGETAKFFLEIGMHCLGCPASAEKALKWHAPFTEPTPTSLSEKSTLI